MNNILVKSDPNRKKGHVKLWIIGIISFVGLYEFFSSHGGDDIGTFIGTIFFTIMIVYSVDLFSQK